MEQMEDLSSNHSFSESKEYNSEKTHSLHEQETIKRTFEVKNGQAQNRNNSLFKDTNRLAINRYRVSFSLFN